MACMSSAAPPGYVTQSPDTSYEAEQRQLAIWRAMTPKQKFAIVDELRRGALALAAIGDRLRNASPVPAQNDATVRD